MMRSLWTGASGMTSQQLNVDVISNNISNVNTTGYKKERAEFQTLMYQTLKEPTTDVNRNVLVPNTMQIGHGVKPAAISRVYTMGSLQRTENTFDFALNGKGFLVIEVDGEPRYTRDGSFKLSENNGALTLVTSDGFPVLDTNGEHITFEGATDLTVDPEGRFFQPTGDGMIDLGIQFDIVQFTNSQGLETIGKNLYKETLASGGPLKETEEDLESYTSITQGFLEMSNVNIADEMVNMIVAQRAYELNSKVITTSDDMLQQANNLKK